MGGFGLGRTPTSKISIGSIRSGSCSAPRASSAGWTGLISPAISYAMNADGSDKQIPVGQDVNVMSTGTHIQTKKTEMIAAFLIDDLPDDDKNVLILARPFSGDSYDRVEKMDVYSGRRVPVARSPVRNADYLADGKGVVRFAWGTTCRTPTSCITARPMRPIGRRRQTGRSSTTKRPATTSRARSGFPRTTDTRTCRSSRLLGPMPSWHSTPPTAAGRRCCAMRWATRTESFAHWKSRMARRWGIHRRRQAAYRVLRRGKRRSTALPQPRGRVPGSSVAITSKTRDGSLALVEVRSDRDPGSFYLFDTVNKKASFLLARRDWIDPGRWRKSAPSC